MIVILQIGWNKFGIPQNLMTIKKVPKKTMLKIRLLAKIKKIAQKPQKAKNYRGPPTCKKLHELHMMKFSVT